MIDAIPVIRRPQIDDLTSIELDVSSQALEAVIGAVPNPTE